MDLQMKNLFFHFLSVFLTMLCLFSNNSNFVGAVDPLFLNCSVSRFCGSQLISFPFYTEEEHKLCGFPGFRLSCNYNNGGNPIPILNLNGNDYVVHKIFYENQSLLVSNAAFSTSNTACFPLIRSLSLPSEFTLASDEINSKVFLIQNCTSSSDLLEYKIGCSAGNDSKWVLALPEKDEKKVAEASGKCGIESNEVLKLPVMEYNNEEEMREVLSRGFMLNWTASDCTLCNSTGGKCGFEYGSYHFKCFCPDRPHAARCGTPGKTGLDTKAGIAAAVAGIGLFLIMILFYLRKKSFISSCNRQDQIQKNVEAFLSNHGPLQVKRYSYRDVKKMTNSFVVKLGRGGFGDVYKGKLDAGSLVAVKVLNQAKGEDGQEFINEVATISRTSHVNVVTLLGFCFESTKRALIYEFMPNGSLEKLIFDENTIESSHWLNWETRYKISLGIAKGLEYLHIGCNTRILHFDIKPHNILLDADFVPKISDFGLAKICTRKESCLDVGPRGTIGYIAPEVFSRNFGGVVSHKSDVYSYGMMILELVGGRRNVDVTVDNTSEIYFPHWVYKRLELDEEVGLKRIGNEEDRVKAKKMIIIALWCIQTDPSNRPTMSEVIQMLEGALDSLQVPPKPFLCSPSRSPPAESSST